jgi:hypothetical protein
MHMNVSNIFRCIILMAIGSSCTTLKPQPQAFQTHGLVRQATEPDLPSIERIAQQKFAQYAAYQPLYYKVAKDSPERHLLYLGGQLKAGKQIMLVHDIDGRVDGFLMANIVTPPPVYDQSLHSLVIDDFYFSNASLWSTDGLMMLEAAKKLGRERGAVQVVVVSGNDDAVKNEFLYQHGLSRSAVWYTSPFVDPATQK